MTGNWGNFGTLLNMGYPQNFLELDTDVSTRGSPSASGANRSKGMARQSSTAEPSGQAEKGHPPAIACAIRPAAYLWQSVWEAALFTSQTKGVS